MGKRRVVIQCILKKNDSQAFTEPVAYGEVRGLDCDFHGGGLVDATLLSL